MKSNFFIADIHIHSKYSRATAQNLDIENIYIWSQLKGIEVVGTGDFTHPEWFHTITDKLEPAEPGLYRLKKDIARQCDQQVPLSCRGRVRFMLSCEISSIYKKNGRTRKNHNLVLFPYIDDVRRFNERLNAIGNIESDGRPILGLDARDLLEIVLDTSEDGFLVPAHIWTPWFSMLGSKSGFDSIEACFEDLSSYIFAAETGLSSDPAMNWRVGNLDNITLISNSDAHSPSKLGREANLFKTDMNFFAMRAAMQNGDEAKFGGTFEFYPEEGKYHVDGHRKCDVCLTPAQTQACGGICPVCGKPLTLGVLHRVESLATRPDGVRPNRAFPFYRLIPLDDLLSDIFKVGPQSKKVKATYHDLLKNIGNEFKILHFLPVENIAATGVPLLAEAIGRMRSNQVSFSPGYDGQFGKVQLFTDQERSQLLGQQGLFTSFDNRFAMTETKHHPEINSSFNPPESTMGIKTHASKEPVIRLNQEQLAAVKHTNGHMVIIAGPGTGKTRTLTQKIAHLIRKGTNVDQILAVTFTNKAAEEMVERLRSNLGKSHPLPFVGTFHALGYQIIDQSMADTPLSILDENNRKKLVHDVMQLNGLSTKKKLFRTETLMGWIADAKQNLINENGSLERVCPDEYLNSFKRCYQSYQNLLQTSHLADFEDLIFRSIQLLQNDSRTRDHFIGKYSNIFIDEYQDINQGQYRLVKMLAGKNADICIIGDPDQSIYGFRGSDVTCFKWFEDDYGPSRTAFLNRNYRSTQTILDVSTQVIRNNPVIHETAGRRTVYSDIIGERTIQTIETASEKAEAVAIGKTIESMVGGTGFFSLDSGAVDDAVVQDPLSFADFVVLFRTRNQGVVISRILEKAGIPCQHVDRNTVLDHPGIGSAIALFRIIKRLGLVTDFTAASEMMQSPVSNRVLETFKRWAYHNHMDLEHAMVQACRLPIPHMGRAGQQQLYALIRQMKQVRLSTEHMPVADTIEQILNVGDTREKFADDPTFEKGRRIVMKTAQTHSYDAAGFLATLNMSSHTDIYDHRVEAVSLMTMHAAKGLEFSVVFIAGCEENWIPYRSEKRPTELEEERRLFYVAMTRAKRHLIFTKAARRRINGQMQRRRWSPFVEEIKNSYKQVMDHKHNKKQKPLQKQLSLF